jgi:hypothetical protein
MTRRYQFSLTALLISVTIAAALIAAASYVYRERELARARDSVKVRMTQLATAIYQFNDTHQRLPKANETDLAGHSLSSWRFMLWPYWDCQESGFQGNTSQPWTAPINSQWRNAIAPRIFSPTNRTLNSPNVHDTNVFAITGPGTAFDPQKTVTAQQLGAAPPASQVILFVEVRNSKTHWMQPGDFDIRTMPHTINDPAGEGISGTCPGCFCVCFATTEAWMLRNDTPFDKLALFFTIDSARKHDREVGLGPYRVK